MTGGKSESEEKKTTPGEEGKRKRTE